MYRLFIIVIFSILVGCTTSQEANSDNFIEHPQQTCGDVKMSYKVVVSYIDTSYAFGSDSSTLAEWDLLLNTNEVDLSICRQSDVEVFQVIHLNYDKMFSEIVADSRFAAADSLHPIDSVMMVNWAEYWRSNGYHGYHGSY